MNLLEKLTDIGLRRLYKFVLKRSIGRYLDEELRLDQVKVQSRDGLVTINNVGLNCDVLNEEIMNLSVESAFILKRASVE